jgi:steroid delta-isomerase-like uncharacterized protein
MTVLRRRTNTARHTDIVSQTPTALDVTSEYVAALAARDSKAMDTLRSPDFILDFVHGDAAELSPLSAEETRQFWSAWFVAFPELDYEVTRTIVAEKVIVMQWTFTGRNTGPLPPLPLDEGGRAMGRTIRLRGLSVYDVSDGFIQRETAYLDMATLMVELGVEF